MAAENDILIKITCEADKDAAQKALKDLVSQAYDLEQHLKSLKKAEQEEIAQLKQQQKEIEKTIAKTEEYIRDNNIVGKGLEQLNEDIEKQRKEYNNLSKNIDAVRAKYKPLILAKKEEIETNKKSIKSLNDQIKTYKSLQGQSGRMVTQLRAMREELQRMEDAGEFGTEAFINLSIAAGKLEDQIGDTQQRIRILASDTKVMDAAMGLGDGLAGTFYIATSAAEILGDDMEGLQKAFYKVQAAMSILSGAQQVFNALNKDSAAMVVINTALTKLFGKAKAKSAVETAADAAASTVDAGAKTAEAIATEGAAKAQMSLNAAFLANPVGFVLAGIVAVTAAIYAMYKALNKVDRARRQAEKSRKLYDKQLAASSAALDVYNYNHQVFLRDISQRETKRLNQLKKEHSSQLSIANAELSSLKERENETKRYSEEATKANNLVVASAKKAREDAWSAYKKTKQGTKEQEEALAKYTEAQNNYIDALNKKHEIEDETAEATQAVVDKEQEIANLRTDLIRTSSQLDIEAMKDGVEKEKAQINANYEERIRQYEGNTALETSIREKLIAQRDKEIEEAERKSNANIMRTVYETIVSGSEELANALRGNEGLQVQLDAWQDYYNSRRELIDFNERYEKEEVERTIGDETLKQQKLNEIAVKYGRERTALAKEESQKRIEISNQEVSALELAADKASHAAERAQGPGRLDALKASLDAQLDLYDAQEAQLDAQWKAGVISYQDYEQQKWEITKAAVDARVQYETDALQTIADGFEQAIGYMQQISDMAFEAINSNIQAEMDALDEEYTTDAEEAAKNANKKYITEAEYEKKKADLQMRQAKYAKTQALINAGINTAQAIVTTLAQLGATPWGIAASIIAGAMGAAQMAIIASKPLAQYEKGRKGGPGEYALVGEKGPEIMYIPRGASIVPNDKIETPTAWARYGVPELPHANPDTLHYAAEQTAVGFSIDYDRLGASVAAALPKQRSNNVTVNVDRSGITVSDSLSTRHYLNQKYTGTWN